MGQLDAPWRNLKASVSLPVTETYLASRSKCAVATGLGRNRGYLFGDAIRGEEEKGVEVKVPVGGGDIE